MKVYEIKKVLAAIDFSEVSMNALQTAITICKKHGASLTIVHVIENTRFLYTAAGGLAAISLLPELTRTSEERLSDLAVQIRNAYHVNVAKRVLTGHPAEAICQEALRSDSDLVVIGSHGTSSMKQLFVGSTAYFVAKSCSSPVLTIPGTDPWLDFRKILFPVRPDSFSHEKYDFISPIIRKERSSLMLAGIIDKTNHTTHYQVEGIVQDLHTRCVTEDVICNVRVYECKNMAAQVLDIANCEKPDLIVITTTTNTTIWDLFTVAYPQEVVNKSHFPVLSIRPTVEVSAQLKAAQYIDDRLVRPGIAFG